jgi:hypothetical protein
MKQVAEDHQVSRAAYRKYLGYTLDQSEQTNLPVGEIPYHENIVSKTTQ